MVWFSLALYDDYEVYIFKTICNICLFKILWSV